MNDDEGYSRRPLRESSLFLDDEKEKCIFKTMGRISAEFVFFPSAYSEQLGRWMDGYILWHCGLLSCIS